ncbi:MAG: hypothetical protein QNI90_12220 [Dinoroseobacter sp.]|nr:hypothetical protein [Dinoroseobacter sp.]
MRNLTLAIAAAFLFVSAQATANPKTPSGDQLVKMASPQWVGKELKRSTTHSRNHYGQTRSGLKSQAAASDKPKSSFADKKTAIKATRKLIQANSKEIAQWLKTAKPGTVKAIGTQTKKPLAGVNMGQGKLGTAATPGGMTIPAYGARVVLQRDPKSKLGFRIKNAYPVVARSTPKQLKTFRSTPPGRMGSQFRRVAPPPRLPR